MGTVNDLIVVAMNEVYGRNFDIQNVFLVYQDVKITVYIKKMKNIVDVHVNNINIHYILDEEVEDVKNV